MTDKTIFKVFLNKKIPIEKSMRLTYSFRFLYFFKNESVLHSCRKQMVKSGTI